MPVRVVTAITAGRDRLKQQPRLVDAEYVAFLDREQRCPGWTLKPAYAGFTDPVRNARHHKVLTHRWLPSATYSLWIDGSVRLTFEHEKQACEPFLFRQIELIQPKVITTLGNHATKQLTGKDIGITRVHGREQQVTLGSMQVLLYPLYHPAAALYTPAMLKVLEEDFSRLLELLGRFVVEPELAEPENVLVAAEPAVQLDLF